MTEQEKSQLRTLLQDPRWKTVEHVANMLIGMIQQESDLRDTNDEILRSALIREGRVAGIKNLIQTIYQNAQ